MPELKGSRKDLAVLFSEDRWQTAHEAAQALGKPTGSIFGVMRRMHEAKLLDADSDPEPPSRGTQYRLSALGHRALAAALAEPEPVGQLEVGQGLIFVERGSIPNLNRVLASPELSGFIAWSAKWGPGWLLALTPSASPAQRETLAEELQLEGFVCHEGQAEALLSGPQLRGRASQSSRKAQRRTAIKA